MSSIEDGVTKPQSEKTPTGEISDVALEEEAEAEAAEAVVEQPDVTVHNAEIRGARLIFTMLLMSFALMLATIETTIVSTTLVTISSDLEHFNIAGWIVVAYLLTYCAFLIIFSRLSDFFGRKNAILSALLIFTIFSGLCGAAQTMVQLIVFRAFQGMGGGGIYSMTIVVLPEIAPVNLMGLASGLVAGAFAISSIIGPLLGGVIVAHSTWRWVFLLNVPCGVVIMVIVYFIYPSRPGSEYYIRDAVRKVDWLGVALSITATTLLLFAFEEAGLRFPWKSAAVIASLILSGACWVCFGFWQHFLTEKEGTIAPIFPMMLAKNRVIAAALSGVFFVGTAYMVVIIGLPQRFQIVNGNSPIKAGIRLIPLMVSGACGSGFGGAILSRNNHAFWVLVGGTAFQVIGTGLMSTIPFSDHVLPRVYGFMVLHGLGFGSAFVALLIVCRVEVKANYQASIMGASTQLRILGAVIGLAFANTALNNYTSSRLGDILTPEQRLQLAASSKILSSLPPSQALETRKVFNDAFNLQMKIVMAFCILSVIISAGAFRRHPLSLENAGLGEGERVEVIKKTGDEEKTQSE